MISYSQNIKRFLPFFPKTKNITEKITIYYISPTEIWVDTEFHYSNINYYFNFLRYFINKIF